MMMLVLVSVLFCLIAFSGDCGRDSLIVQAQSDGAMVMMESHASASKKVNVSLAFDATRLSEDVQTSGSVQTNASIVLHAMDFSESVQTRPSVPGATGIAAPIGAEPEIDERAAAQAAEDARLARLIDQIFLSGQERRFKARLWLGIVYLSAGARHWGLGIEELLDGGGGFDNWMTLRDHVFEVTGEGMFEKNMAVRGSGALNGVVNYARVDPGGAARVRDNYDGWVDLSKYMIKSGMAHAVTEGFVDVDLEETIKWVHRWVKRNPDYDVLNGWRTTGGKNCQQFAVEFFAYLTGKRLDLTLDTSHFAADLAAVFENIGNQLARRMGAPTMESHEAGVLSRQSMQKRPTRLGDDLYHERPRESALQDGWHGFKELAGGFPWI